MRVWFRIVLYEAKADNEEMYAYVDHRDTRKYYRCANCGKIAQEAN